MRGSNWADRRQPAPPGSERSGQGRGSALARVGAMLAKDLRSEIRSAAAATAIGMFALVTLTVVSFAAGPVPLGSELKGALLWVVLFFASSVGLSRTFVKEEETKTAIALRLTAPPAVVLAGKLLFNSVLMGLLAIVLVPLYVVLMSVSVPDPWTLIALVATGVLALAAGSTIVAAIISRAQVKGPLFGALTFPVMMPVLLLEVRGTARVLEGAPWPEISSYLYGVVGFAGAMTTVSFLLFEAVWDS